MRPRFLTLLLLAVLTGLSTGCTRRPLDEGLDGDSAAIPVKIDWSGSNIPVTEDDPKGGTAVHRVSIRFYPLDGSPVFERYLEGNVFQGTIDVPAGSYRVIAMNESVEDVRYWEDAITFSDVDDYDHFSATVNPMAAADITADFPFYRPASGETVIVEPLRLASWSLDHFEVTEGSNAVQEALTGIVMRPLTRNVNLTARVANLVSVQSMPAAVRGFADKVYIASARTEQSPATHLLLLNRRSWDAGGMDGTVRRTFLSFGRLPGEDAGSYGVALDVLLVSGELFTAAGPMLFDVTEQVAAASSPDIDLSLGDPPGSPIELPYVEGGISVDDWDDEEITLN